MINLDASMINLEAINFGRSCHLISRRGYIASRLFNSSLCCKIDFTKTAEQNNQSCTLTNKTDHQLVTLKRAVRRDGIICRLRIDRGTVRSDIYWKPPRYKRSLARFVGAMPLALIIDLRRAGFASLGAESVPIAGLSETGILWASLVSNDADAEQLVRSIFAGYGLADSDRAVAWTSRAPKSARQANGPSPCEGASLSHAGSLAAYADNPRAYHAPEPVPSVIRTRL
jgi:hypothetical protein